MTLAKCATLVHTCCMRSQPKVWHFTKQAHACTKFHHCFQHSGAYFTPRSAIKSGVGKHPLPPLRLQAVWFLLTSCHHQQNRPSCPTFVVEYTSPSTGTQVHAFVWRCNGSGPRYFVCASLGSTLTFWRREFSPNERDAESINLPQPNVELFLIRVDEPSQLRQSHQT